MEVTKPLGFVFLRHPRSDRGSLGACEATAQLHPWGLMQTSSTHSNNPKTEAVNK